MIVIVILLISIAMIRYPCDRTIYTNEDCWWAKVKEKERDKRSFMRGG